MVFFDFFFTKGIFAISSCPCTVEGAAGTSQSLSIKYCNTVNKFKDWLLNDFFFSFFFVFSFLFCLTLVQLYDMTAVFHGLACRVETAHLLRSCLWCTTVVLS